MCSRSSPRAPYAPPAPPLWWQVLEELDELVPSAYEEPDFLSEDRLEAIAAAANMTAEAFTERYGYLCAQDAFCPRN